MSDSAEELKKLREGLLDAHLRIEILEAIVGALSLGFVRVVKGPNVSARENAERFTRSMLAISGMHDTVEGEAIVLERLRQFGAQLAEMAEPKGRPNPQ